MLTTSKSKICVVNENHVFDNKMTYQLEIVTKLFFKINNNMFYNGRLTYYCRNNKFYDNYRLLFEYNLKNRINHSTLTLNNENLSQSIVFNKKFGFNIQFEFLNPVNNEMEVYLFKTHLFGKSYEIYNKKNSSIVCTIKKNGVFGSDYTIDIEKGVDNAFMLMVVSVLLNMTQRTRAAAASA